MMNQSDRQKIQQTITLLQQVLGQKSSSSAAVPKIQIQGLDQQINNLVQISQTLQPEVKQLTNAFLQALSTMQATLNYSAVSKAPSEAEKKALNDKFMGYSKRTQNVQKSQPFKNHARAVRQMISVPYWVLTTAPQFVVKGGIESADFNAIKFQKNKNQAHNDWWKSIGKISRIIEDYCKRQYPMGLNYNANGTHSWGQLLSGGQSQAPQQNQPPQHQQQASQPQQVAQQAPKAPKRQFQNQTWMIANLAKDKVSFGPGEIDMKHRIFIQNCNQCFISIDQKFKSLQISNCSKVSLVVNSSISGIQLMNCNNVQIHAKGQNPSISIDKSSRIKVVLNQAFLNCDVLTSKVSQVNVAYEKAGNQSKTFMVAEQLLTKWNQQKNNFETVVYDKFL